MLRRVDETAGRPSSVVVGCPTKKKRARWRKDGGQPLTLSDLTCKILRHILDLKLPYQVAEQSLGVSHGLVCRTLAKVRAHGLSWPDIAPLSEEELELLLYGSPKLPVPLLAMLDWAQIGDSLV